MIEKRDYTILGCSFTRLADNKNEILLPTITVCSGLVDFPSLHLVLTINRVETVLNGIVDIKVYIFLPSKSLKYLHCAHGSMYLIFKGDKAFQQSTVHLLLSNHSYTYAGAMLIRSWSKSKERVLKNYYCSPTSCFSVHGSLLGISALLSGFLAESLCSLIITFILYMRSVSSLCTLALYICFLTLLSQFYDFFVLPFSF